MDNIFQIIHTFEAEDAQNFKRFVKRTKTSDNRKDVQLFDLMLNSEEARKDYCQVLYAKNNDHRYQALRKRLMLSLNKFIALKLMDNDSSDASQVLSWVNMARYLLSYSLDALAWRYLQKAEKAALKNDLFEILNTIYVLQIQHLPNTELHRQQEILEKWQQNKKQLELNEKGEIAVSILSRKIQQARGSHNFTDIEKLIKSTLSELDLHDEFLLQPRFVYHLAQLNRTKMLVKKDFFNLEPFLIKQYNLINEKQGFGSKYNYYKLGFLYMIAHILFRNKKFDQSAEYVRELEVWLFKSSKSQQNEFYPKCVLLKANVLLFNGKLDEAIAILSQTKKEMFKSFSPKNQMNLIINLGIAHFQNQEYRKTLQILNEIKHSDNWCEKKMGREWVMKKALMEVLLFIELEETSVVDSKLRYVSRSFRDMFDLPLYARVKQFLQFVKAMSQNPTSQGIEKIRLDLENSFDWIPLEYEDLQAVGFYAWLKGKVHGKSSYEVLLELSALKH